MKTHIDREHLEAAIRGFARMRGKPKLPPNFDSVTYEGLVCLYHAIIENSDCEQLTARELNRLYEGQAI